LPNEEQTMDALRNLNLHRTLSRTETPQHEGFNSPEFQPKLKAQCMISVRKPGMGMAQASRNGCLYCWSTFLYVYRKTHDQCKQIISHYTHRGCGLVWTCLFQDAIWERWGATWKMFDALVYGLVTGGTFGWL
jgi:hypothetical protein